MTAADPHTVTLAWTDEQNSGQVSTLRGRVPVTAILDLLTAGEKVDAVAHEYGLTVAEVQVLDRLRADLSPHEGDPT